MKAPDTIWDRIACPAVIYILLGYFPLSLFLSLYWRSLCLALSNYVLVAFSLTLVFTAVSFLTFSRPIKTRCLAIISLALLSANFITFQHTSTLQQYNHLLASSGLSPRLEVVSTSTLIALQPSSPLTSSMPTSSTPPPSVASSSSLPPPVLLLPRPSTHKPSIPTSDTTQVSSSPTSTGRHQQVHPSPPAGTAVRLKAIIDPPPASSSSFSPSSSSSSSSSSSPPSPASPTSLLSSSFHLIPLDVTPKIITKADTYVVSLARSMFGNYAMCCDPIVLQSTAFAEPVASIRMASWNSLGFLFITSALAISYIIVALDDHYVFDYAAALSANALAHLLPSKFSRLPLQYPYPATGLTAITHPAALGGVRPSVDD